DVMGDEPVWAILPEHFDRTQLATETPHGYGAQRFDQNGQATAAVSGQTDRDWNVVGWVTSGGYGHSVGLSLAQGYIPATLVDLPNFQIEILGNRCNARILHEPPFDPQGSKMRS
ncbi:MAG: glycine cleavage T C-terminal barrel domain-containing protein, partial [Pseudomonadota bacterium]